MVVRLFVLGLLYARPRHGYEIRKWLETRRTDLWTGVLPGSIYHALKQMTREGFVRLRSTERSGQRVRAIYAITPRGRREFKLLLREAWRTPPKSIPTGINSALTFINDLPRREVMEAVTETIATLEQVLKTWTSGDWHRPPAPSRKWSKAEYTVMTEMIRAAFINGREHINADLKFLRRIRAVLARAE
jgi:DNA-binding PadR family transcriptional regulator